jgi:F0F1-type ATP synthase assembly protein I
LVTQGPKRRRHSGVVAAGKLTAVAFEFVGFIMGSVILGYLADRQFETDPWFLIGFTLFGTIAGFFQMIRTLRVFQRDVS